MSSQLRGDPRVLILLNPGRQSRHYLIGLAGGARRAGIPCLTLELGPIWQRAAGPGSAAVLAEARRQVGDLVRRQRISHVIGYVFNGTHDLGLEHGSDGRPQTIWDHLAVRHLLLWTDHPEWATSGRALDEPLRTLLGGENRTHLLKSGSASAEAAAVLGWPNVHALAMAEDYNAIRPVTDIRPIHDAVVVIGDAAAPHPSMLPFLDADDPDPAMLDAEMRPQAERAWRKVIGPDRDALAAAWLDLKQANPEDSFWRLAACLQPAHADSLAWLRSDPRRWYSAVQALRRMTGWRRNFWLAWLGRRVNLGIYGSSAAPLGVPQTADGAAWVAYEQQSAVYARGRVALNINAPHDEEGLTHKPFQIAASGVACIHHSVRGLEASFLPGQEVITFRRGPELLEAIRSLAADEPRRRDLASAMHARAIAEHTWHVRLGSMLELAGPAAVRVPPAAAA